MITICILLYVRSCANHVIYNYSGWPDGSIVYYLNTYTPKTSLNSRVLLVKRPQVTEKCYHTDSLTVLLGDNVIWPTAHN